MTSREPHPEAKLFLPVAMGILVAALYFNTRYNPFMIDDHQAIVDHPLVFHPRGLTEAWLTDYWAGETEDTNLYRPVTILSYHLNARLIGWHPVAIGFRVLNILLLWGVAWLAAWWMGRYMNHPAGAWLAAFLLAAHPTNTEVINHIVGRADLLAMLGVIGFLLAQRRAQIHGHWTPLVALAGLVFAVTAFGSKETGVLLVPAALLQSWLARRRPPLAAADAPVGKPLRLPFELRWWMLVTPIVVIAGVLLLRRFSQMEVFFLLISGAGAAALIGVAMLIQGRQQDLQQQPDVDRSDVLARRRRVMDQLFFVRVVAIVLLVLPLTLYAVGRVSAVGLLPSYTASPNDDLTGNPLRGLGFVERLPGALSLAWFYFSQIIWPDPSFNHNPTYLPTWASASTWGGLAVMLTWCAAMAVAFRKRHWVLIPLALAGGQYLIVGNLLFATGAYGANRLMLPFTFAGAAVLAALIDRATYESRRQRAVALVLCGSAFLIMGYNVVSANGRWLSEQRLFATENAAKSGNPAAMYLHASAQADVGNYDGAQLWLGLTIKARPDSIQARRQLAGVYVRQGELHAASRQYKQITRLRPDDLHAHVQLGVLSMGLGDPASASMHLRRAEQLAPLDPLVLYNKAELALQTGNYPQALKNYNAVIRLYPNHELHLEATRRREQLLRELMVPTGQPEAAPEQEDAPQ